PDTIHRRKEARRTYLHLQRLLHVFEGIGKAVVAQIIEFIPLTSRVYVGLIRNFFSFQSDYQFKVFIIKTGQVLVLDDKIKRGLRAKFLVEVNNAAGAVGNNALV